VLLVTGVVRSITFTGVNALSFGDVEESDMSQATAINAVMQQLSLATGVALGGALLELSSHTHSGGLTINDFHVAFWVIGIFSALAVIPFLRLAPDAGAVVSGHRARGRQSFAESKE